MKKSSEKTFDRAVFIGGAFGIDIGHRRSVFDTNKMHTHDHCELVVYTEGRKSVFVNDSVYISERGCAFTFRPGEGHFGLHRRGEYHERYVLNFSPRCLDTIPGGASLLRCFFEREAGENNMIVMPEEETAECFRLLDRIIETGYGDLPERQSLMLADFIRCMSLFDRYYMSGLRRGGDVMPELLGGMIRYIDENLTSRLKVADISRRFGVSVATTERLFCGTLLMTPTRFIFMRRIERSKKLLIGGASVTEACYGSGFSDYSHYIADFRRETGMTPARYRGEKTDV